MSDKISKKFRQKLLANQLQGMFSLHLKIKDKKNKEKEVNSSPKK